MPTTKLELIVLVTFSPDGEHATENLSAEVEYKYWGYAPDGERVLEVQNAWWIDGERRRLLTEQEVRHFTREIEDKLLQQRITV